jgi:dTDP-4-dehydrorhamnose reductase
VSTDFVFDGAATSPYTEASATSPLGVYGASKRDGEQRVLGALPHDSVILRTSWLYSEHGANFVKTMLRLMAERDSLSVVNDQIGSPTSAHSLASVILALAEQRLSGAPSVSGLTHWSDGGAISWFDFAVEIQRQALELGLLNKPCELQSIPSSDYPTPAQRPAYSVLDRSRLLRAGISVGAGVGVSAGMSFGERFGESIGERAGLSTRAGEGEGEGESTETNTANNPQSTWQAQLTLVLTALAADNTRQTNG